MKTVLPVICGLFLAFSSAAQREFIMWPTDANTNKIVFTESVYRSETNVATLYANARKFATNNFKGEKDIIILNDTTKTITCKSAFFIPVDELGERGKGYISFTLAVWCHNNSYKYNLTDLEHFPLHSNCVVGGPLENEKAASNAMLFPPRYWNAQKAKCYYRIQTTIEKLKQAMAAEAES